MSGIFRDSFQNVVELLDDAFQKAAAAPGEPEERNYVKKHAATMAAAGLANPAARLFSNPAGDYGSMVNERVGASSWESGDELGETWASRNAFSYGRGGERGTARPEVLQVLLTTTDRVVQVGVGACWAGLVGWLVGWLANHLPAPSSLRMGPVLAVLASPPWICTPAAQS